MTTTRRKLIRISPEGAQVHRFDPTANVRQRHKRRLRFARKHQALFEDYCRVNGIGFRERKTQRLQVAWSIRKAGKRLLTWVPELGRAYVEGMPDVVFKIHDPFVLAWFVEGLMEIEASE